MRKLLTVISLCDKVARVRLDLYAKLIDFVRSAAIHNRSIWIAVFLAARCNAIAALVPSPATSRTGVTAAEEVGAETFLQRLTGQLHENVAVACPILLSAWAAAGLA